MDVFVRPCIYMKFFVRMLADGLLLIMIFLFVFLEFSVQIRLCKSWFNVGAATMFHT